MENVEFCMSLYLGICLEEFGITGYYNPYWLQHAGSRDIDLSCHLLHYIITIHQRYKQKDRWMYVMLVA